MTRKYGKEDSVSSLYCLDITSNIPLHCLTGFSQPETIIVSERKLGFFVQIKEGDPADGGINRRNTLSISSPAKKRDKI